MSKIYGGSAVQNTHKEPNGRWKLTAEPEDVAVHLISVRLKQLGCHLHHLL